VIWVGRLISVAVVLQTIEFFWVRPFRAELLAPEFPKILRWILKMDRAVLTIRLLAAIAALLFPSAALAAILLLTTWMVAIRWRGTFNGGSDFMTFHILAAWSVSLCVPSLEKACLYYIAIQLILSYFVAGIAKILNPSWRNGEALKTFLTRSGFHLAAGICVLLSWVILLFEILYPLSIVTPWPFVVLGGLFHLVNSYVFGLNRFFFAWLAGYPALLILALHG